MSFEQVSLGNIGMKGRVVAKRVNALVRHYDTHRAMAVVGPVISLLLLIVVDSLSGSF
ncbi:hypothetical protein [Halomonas salipaludis]|uniref:hypothetical protein n=1 Tax=Halomonas salipaludis TaxID=2032625 RepID=UPI0015957D67|nr:hypothetical protein [Halomonas salipaludis]